MHDLLDLDDGWRAASCDLTIPGSHMHASPYLLVQSACLQVGVYISIYTTMDTTKLLSTGANAGCILRNGKPNKCCLDYIRTHVQGILLLDHVRCHMHEKKTANSSFDQQGPGQAKMTKEPV